MREKDRLIGAMNTSVNKAIEDSVAALEYIDCLDYEIALSTKNSEWELAIYEFDDCYDFTNIFSISLSKLVDEAVEGYEYGNTKTYDLSKLSKLGDILEKEAYKIKNLKEG